MPSHLSSSYSNIAGRSSCPSLSRMINWCTCLLLTMVGFSTIAQGQEQLKLVANYWEPYTGENLPDQGLATEIVTTALHQAGYTTTVSIVPWLRVLATTYSGNADGIVAVWTTKERQLNLVLSNAYLYNKMVLLHMHGKFTDRKTLADLTGLKIGVGRGYDYNDAFLSTSNFHRDPTDSVLSNLRKLSAGHVDLVLEDQRIAQYNLAIHRAEISDSDKIELADSTLFTLPLYFGVSRNRPDADIIVARFNTAIKKMRADGTIDAIFRRFHQ